MAKILGLDVGTNSIGWSLIDDSRKEILKAGVRVFPEGVNDINTSKEKSKNADRKIARGIRRSNYRFKLRRKRLIRILQELSMMPDERYYTSKKIKGNAKNYLTKELYKLRKDALETPLRLEDLGRIFLQLNNHRGFKSNKKEDADKEFTNKIKDADKINTLEQKQDTLNTLWRRKEKIIKEITELKNSQRRDALKKIKVREKRIKSVEKKINEVETIKTLQEKIANAKSEGKIKFGTLGEYFYYLIELNKDSHNPNAPKGVIRNNDDGEGEYTTREIFEFEFDKIWERQKDLNKDNGKITPVFSDKNKRRIKDECIFYQRDLRSQKHLVDKCNYEYTEYFVYKFDKNNLEKEINHITYSNLDNALKYLDEQQKKSLLERLRSKNEISVAEMKSIIGLKDDFQTFDGKVKNSAVINNLPEERFLQKDYSPCCHVSTLEFQEFRLWDKVNNLRYTDEEDIEHSLTPEQKQILVRKLEEVVLLTIEIGNKASDEEKEEACEIKDSLGLNVNCKFKEQNIRGNVTLKKLKEALGEDYWNSINPQNMEPEIDVIDKSTGEIKRSVGETQYSNKQRQLYSNVVFAMNFIKSGDWLKGKGKAKKWKETANKLGLNEMQLEAYSKISFEPDYCNYSLKAIKRLLPWMKQGLNASQAAEKVGYESASDERKNDEYLQDILPEIKNNSLRNPIVQKGITETIKLINTIIKAELAGQKPDKVHLEMARELKKPKEARQEAKRKNDEKEKDRNQWKEFLKQHLGNEPSGSTIAKFELFLELEHQKNYFEERRNHISVEDFIKFCKEVMGENVSLSEDKFNELKQKLSKKGNEDSPDQNYESKEIGQNEEKGKNKAEKTNLVLLKYRLYLECDRILPYSGQPISLTRLLASNSDIEIEHIIPYSRCMDDSFLNKTLSDKSFNTLKGKQTPMEFFATVDAKTRKSFISRIGKIANEEKRKRFLIEDNSELEKFRNSQITNTAYIATEIKKHLLNTFRRDDIIMTNGQLTSMLRGFLGFNQILNPAIRIPMQTSLGKHWAIMNKDKEIVSLIKISPDNGNERPKFKLGEKILEGFVYIGADGLRFKPNKQRNDQRHHAVDAITIALSSYKITNIIQQNTEGYYVKNGKTIQHYEKDCIWVKKFDENGKLTLDARKKIIEEINEELKFRGLWQEAKNTVDNILVSYNNKNRVISKAKKKIYKNGFPFYSGGDIARGALHEKSMYGNIEYPHSDKPEWREKVNGVYTIRKPLKYNKKGYFEKIEQLEKIIDPTIRNMVTEKAKRMGLKEALNEGIRLPNKNGEPVLIKKVRIGSDSEELISIREHKQGEKQNKKNVWVETGDNYCIVLYGNEVINGKEKREFRTISFLEAVKRTKKNEQLFSQEYKGQKLLTFLSKKDMVLVYKNHPEEVTHLINKEKEDYSQSDVEILFKRLFIVRKADKNGLITLSRHNLSGAKQDEDIPVQDIDIMDGKVIRCNPNTFKGIKICIDRLGNIKPAMEIGMHEIKAIIGHAADTIPKDSIEPTKEHQ